MSFYGGSVTDVRDFYERSLVKGDDEEVAHEDSGDRGRNAPELGPRGACRTGSDGIVSGFVPGPYAMFRCIFPGQYARHSIGEGPTVGGNPSDRQR